MASQETIMGSVTDTEFRQGLASYMDAVCESRAPLTVTRQKGRSIVVMSEQEYNGIMETLHLLKSPANAQRLLTAMASLDAGEGLERDLMD
jgi:antitoxin YefM